MGAIALTIDGVTKRAVWKSIQLSRPINGFATLAIDVDSLDGAYVPVVGKAVVLSRSGTTRFAGILDSFRQVGVVGGQKPIYLRHRINAIHKSVVCERRFVTANIPSQSLSTTLSYLITNFLTGYSITLSGSQAAGPTLAAMTITYMRVDEFLNKLSELSGYVWEIDDAFALRMYAPGDIAATFNVTTGDGHLIGDVEVEPQYGEYANRVILRYHWPGIFAYAFLGQSANFSNGETVVIGSKTYTFQTSLTDVDGNVLIGANGGASLVNLTAAINLSGGSYAASTSKNTQVNAWQLHPTAMGVRANEVGPTGNAIGVSESAVTGSWFTEGNSPTSTLTFGTAAGVGNIAIAEDLTEQASVGIWERVYDRDDITTSTEAQATVTKMLAAALASSKLALYRTRTDGLLPGRTQTIGVASRGVSGSHLIVEVNAAHDGGKDEGLLYTVKARLGTEPGMLWRDVYKQWSGSTGASGASGFSGGSVVSGGGGGSAGVLGPVFLGGSPAVWVQSASPTWVPADGSPVGDVGTEAPVDTSARGTSAAVAKVRLRARSGSVSARVVDESGNVVGTLPSAYTGTTFSWQTFAVALTAGAHRYHLELLPGTANVDVNGIGFLE